MTWTPPRTLFDENDDNNCKQEPSYTVYAYLGNESPAILLYRNESISPSHRVPLDRLNNITACNLFKVLFYVSSKFESVGEGNVSSGKSIDRHSAEIICNKGEKLIANA